MYRFLRDPPYHHHPYAQDWVQHLTVKRKYSKALGISLSCLREVTRQRKCKGNRIKCLVYKLSARLPEWEPRQESEGTTAPYMSTSDNKRDLEEHIGPVQFNMDGIQVDADDIEEAKGSC